MLTLDHAALTADLTVKLYQVPTGKKLRIDRVTYVNPTGLVADGTNFFDIVVLNAAAVAANHSTETGQEGTIAADTFIDLVLSSTDADLVVASGADVSVFFDEDGTATLPVGRIVIEGRLV